MDISLLAQTLATMLAPAMPYLIKGGQDLIAKAGQELGEGSWERVKALWERLRSRVRDKPAATAAAEAVAEAPQDEAKVESLREQLASILAEDQSLAAEIAKLLEPAGGGTTYIADSHGGHIAQGPGAMAGDVVVKGDVHGGIQIGGSPRGKGE
jgi:hypothetical protein